MGSAFRVKMGSGFMCGDGFGSRVEVGSRFEVEKGVWVRKRERCIQFI